jgi:hypothetical protein
MRTPEKSILVDRIIRNGIAIMHRIARMDYDPVRGANTSAWDCRIGGKTTTLALRLFGHTVPSDVKRHMEAHHRQENCHCLMGIGLDMPKELAERIAAFHERVLRENGMLSYLACMPLGGERAALAQAIYHPRKTDPHSTLQGSLSEVWHQSLALLDLVEIAELEPVEKLETAVRHQEELARMLGCEPEDWILISADGEVCTKPGREAHQI